MDVELNAGKPHSGAIGTDFTLKRTYSWDAKIVRCRNMDQYGGHINNLEIQSGNNYIN